MEARISMITLGVSDMRRAYAFYHEGLGFPTQHDKDAGVVFFQTNGTCLALYPKDKLAEDINPESSNVSDAFTGITLAHNVRKGVRMQKRMLATVFAFLAGVYMATSTLAAEHFTVGPGEKHKTISSALAEMKAGDTCAIKEGIYRECIEVRQDNVTLRGEGRVVISGCDQAGKSRPAKVNGLDCMVIDVGKPVYDAFRGEQYLSPARFPNKTAPMTSNMDWENTVITPDGTTDFGKHEQRQFPELNDGYYVGLHGRGGKLSSWYSLTLPITGIGEHGNIEVNEEEASSGFMGNYGKGKGLGYIIGAKAVLDAPGEWYSDGQKLFLIPPSGGKGGYELRTRLYGAVVTGAGVRLEGIRFKAATIRVDGNGVSLVKCAFDYISPFRHNANDAPKNKRGQSLVSCWGTPENGTAGVFVKGDRFVAEDCRFSKSWWCGMMIRGNNARVDNCLFEDMNWMAKRCAGLFSWGDDNTVRYCTFRNLGGSGIEGGNANWIGQYAKRNVWEYNYIEDVSKLIIDQGFFYVNHQSGSNPTANSVWRYNVGKTVRGPKKGNWAKCAAAYYVDNSSSGYHIHNNIAIDAVNPMKHNDTQDGDKASKDIWYYNNTFYSCGRAAFGSFGQSKKRDADLNLVNNLAVSCAETALGNKNVAKTYKNNFALKDKSAFRNAQSMDFTPTDGKLGVAGVPVLGTPIPYVGAVDPEKGMWRYGADESRLPEPQ
jgi:catechol 2,3-dioxygenase-like lactoylglutathione lyase family enzyme